MDEPTVEISLTAGLAAPGQEFLAPYDTARVTIKSLTSLLARGPATIHVSYAKRPDHNPSGWLTSWNKVLASPNTLSLYVTAHMDVGALWQILAESEDFSLDSPVAATNPMEVFATSTHVAFGAINTRLPETIRIRLLKDPRIILSYWGLPNQYLGELQGNRQQIAAKLNQTPMNHSVVLFPLNKDSHPIPVKPGSLSSADYALMAKQKIAIFTQPVKEPAFIAR